MVLTVYITQQAHIWESKKIKSGALQLSSNIHSHQCSDSSHIRSYYFLYRWLHFEVIYHLHKSRHQHLIFLFYISAGLLFRENEWKRERGGAMPHWLSTGSNPLEQLQARRGAPHFGELSKIILAPITSWWHNWAQISADCLKSCGNMNSDGFGMCECASVCVWPVLALCPPAPALLYSLWRVSPLLLEVGEWWWSLLEYPN